MAAAEEDDGRHCLLCCTADASVQQWLVPRLVSLCLLAPQPLPPIPPAPVCPPPPLPRPPSPQVKTAVPNVEEHTYKKGSLLVQQGQVAEGLFLILAGTCELVLLSHMPEQQQQQGGHTTPPASPKQPSFTSKITTAVQGSRKLQRTQSSSPVVAMPAKRDTDLDFAAQLSDSDETTCSEDDDGGGFDLQQQQYCGCLPAEQQGAALDPEAVKPGFPFFRLTASADGARRLQPPGGLLLGRPWPPPAACRRASSPSPPPPIIEGMPCSLSGLQDDGFSCNWQAVEGEQEREDSSTRLPSFRNSGGWVPGPNPGTDSPGADAGSQPGSRRAAGHAKSCSVDFGVLEVCVWVGGGEWVRLVLWSVAARVPTCNAEETHKCSRMCATHARHELLSGCPAALL